MSTVITWSEFPPPIQTGFGSNLENAVNDSKALGTAIIEFTQFIKDVKNEGFSVALFGKPFSEVFIDAITDAFVAIGRFIMGNGDLFFLLPAIAIITGTFLVGRNKYTKWIIPLLFAYGVSRAFFRMLL